MVPNQDRSSGMKAKVILSFTLAMATFVTLGFLAYASFDKLLGAVHQISKPNDRSKNMNAIVMHLSEAESSMRAYSLSRDWKYYKRYLSEVAHVNTLAEGLMQSDWHDRVEPSRLDSISVLLNQKIIKLQDFLSRKSRANIMYSQKALEQLDENVLDSTTLTTISKVTSTESRSVDTLLVYRPVQDIEKAEGIFNKIKKLLSKKEPVETSVDTITRITHETKYEYDTNQIIQPDTLILNEVKQILQAIREEEYNHHRREVMKEMELLEANSVIINQVKQIIKELEDSESSYYTQQKAEAQAIVRDHLTVIVFIIALAFLGCFICILLIFGDISRSNFYKGRLEKAKSRAEKLARTREQFLANVSHELRTPLNAITGFTEQLSGTDLSPRQGSYLSIISNSSRHLLSLVNDILDMSKIEAGGFELNETPFDLREIVEETYQTFKARGARKDLQVCMEIPEDLHTLLFGDGVRLKQVLFNIMDNAIKFTDRGEVKIEITQQQKGEHWMQMEFRISDSGSGIPENQQHRIFNNFYQGDGTRTKKHLGAGLGLAISQRIIKAMGGEIEVESQVNIGTTFTIKVRFAPLDRISEDIQENEVKISERFSKMRILIIDDDHFNCTLLQTILGDIVQQLECASNAREGLRHLKKSIYDLVLTDIHMPEMDGITLLKRVRALDSRNQNVPVVAITADGTRSKEQWVEQNGFHDHITKPFRQKTLLATISRIVDQDNVTLVTNVKEDVTINLKTLSVFAGGNTATLINLLEVFHQNAVTDLDTLQLLYKEKRFDEFKEQAHKMISPFAQLGIDEVVKLLRQIERKEKADVRNSSEIDHLTTMIKESLHLVQEKIRDLKKQNQVPV